MTKSDRSVNPFCEAVWSPMTDCGQHLGEQTALGRPPIPVVDNRYSAH
jgi:hypothetical protein